MSGTESAASIRLGKLVAPLYWVEGRSALALGDYRRAIEYFSHVVQIVPNDWSGYEHRARAYEATGQYRSAVADLTEAIRLGPTDHALYTRRGRAYNLLDEDVRAAWDFSAALRLQPGDPEVFHARGCSSLRSGAVARALEDFDQALRLSPDNPTYLANRAAAHDANGDPDRALDDFAQAYLRASHAPGNFVAGLRSLQGIPTDGQCLIQRLTLLAVDILEATRNQWDTPTSGAGGSVNYTEALVSAIHLAKGLAGEALGILPVGELYRGNARLDLEEGERFFRAASQEGEPGRYSHSFLFGYFLNSMCLEGVRASGDNRWPDAPFWDALLFLTEARIFAQEGSVLSEFSRLPAAQVAGLFLCAVGPRRAATEVERRWLSGNDGLVPKLARMIHSQGQFEDMPILSDALIDGGCADEGVIGHCRERWHCGGCWVLASVLEDRALHAAARTAGGDTKYDGPRFRLELPRSVYQDMVAHALADAPLMSWGVLAGHPSNSPTIEGIPPTVRGIRYYPLVNALESSTAYESDGLNLFHALRDVKRARLKMVGIVHSVTRDPIPSRRCLEMNVYPEAVQLIISLKNEEPELGVWWLDTASYEPAEWEWCDG